MSEPHPAESILRKQKANPDAPIEGDFSYRRFEVRDNGSDDGRRYLSVSSYVELSPAEAEYLEGLG